MRRRNVIGLIVLGILLFLVISALLTRALSVGDAEDAAITSLVKAEARGDSAGVISLITDNNGGENGTNIVLLGSTTFDGGGDVYMGGTSPWDDFLEGSYRSAGFTLTNVNETFSGAGSIGNTSLGVGPLKIVNEAHGVIDGDNATQQLVISTGGYTVANAGIMEGTAAGGLNIEAAVDNTGTIRATAGGVVNLSGINIFGGILATLGSGVIDVNGSAGVINVDNTGRIALGDGDVLYVSGALVNSGTISLAGANHGANLQLAGAVTLSGGGDIVLGGATPYADAIAGDFYAAGGTLVNVNNTISGGGSVGFGGIESNPLGVTNDAAGVIDGDSDISTLTLNTDGAGPIVNLGLIEATSAPGVTLSGTEINNAGGTILAAKGSQFDLNNNANVTGGVLVSTGTGMFDIDGSASLTSPDSEAQIEVASDDILYLGGAIDNTETITLTDGGALEVGTGVTTLTGGGQVIMGGTISPANNAIGGDGYSSTDDALVNVNNTISGGGAIGAAGATLVTFTNDAGGMIDANSKLANITFNAGSSGSVVNLGLIEATGGGAVSIAGTQVVNTGGTIDARANSIVNLYGNAGIYGGVLQSGVGGAFDIGAASFTSLETEGAVDLSDGDVLYLGGVIDNTGTISLAGAGHGAALEISGGVSLTGAGLVLMGGSTPWNNAIDGNPYAPGGVLTNVNDTITGGGSIGGGNPLVVVNDAAGVVDANSDLANITLNSAGAGAITNLGLIEATGGGGVTISGTEITNTGGTISAGVNSVITLNNNANITGGVLKTAPVGGAIDISGGGSFSNLDNEGLVNVGNGDALYVGGSIDNTGTISLAGQGGGAQVCIVGAMTLSGGGTILLGGTGPWNDSVTYDQYDHGGTLTNDSTIAGEGYVGNYITLINGKTGVIDGVANAGFALNVQNGNTTITNEGLIEASTGGVTEIYGFVNNTGTIAANGGDLVINAGAGGVGKLAVDGGTLEVVTAGMAESVMFGSGGGTLQLDASQSFTGRVSGFSASGTTTIDLRDIAFVSPSEATFVEDGAGTAGVLTVTASGSTSEITLVGDYSGDTFVASSDGSSGTNVVTEVTPAPAASPLRLAAAISAMGAGAAASTRDALASRLHPLPVLAAHA